MSTKVITDPDTRWSYVHVWEPTSYNGGKPKYSVSLIIPKDNLEMVDRINAAISEEIRGNDTILKGNGKIRTPLRDGDAERPDDPAYENALFINANSVTRPGIIDANLQEITDQSEVYSGVYGRASITFYAYNTAGNKGIACGLNNLQKIRDGEPLGGKPSAAEDFAGLDEDDDEGFLD